VECARGNAPEQIYLVRIDRRSLLRAQIESDYDGAIYLSRSCGDPDEVMECNDDAGDLRHSLVSTFVDPGEYFVVVDGYGGESGDYQLTVDTVTSEKVERLACLQAPDLPPGESRPLPASADDWFDGSCFPGGGVEHVFAVDLEERSRLDVRVEESPRAVVYLRRGCTDRDAEIACVPASSLTRTLDAGRYYVVVEGFGPDGRVSLEAEPVGASGDGACGEGIDVQPLPMEGSVSGSTRGRGNRFEASCADRARSDDAVYHLQLQEPSTVRLLLMSQFDGALHLRSASCADPIAEIACNDDLIDTRHSVLVRDLRPGDYYVVVDGYGDGNSGDFRLQVTTSPTGALP